MKNIDFYILRRVAGPLLLTLAVAAFLLLLERMLRLFDLVVHEGGPFVIVWRMLVNLVPHYMALALPAALFIGVLVAFRKLSDESEIDAMQAGGMGFARLVRPIAGLAVLLVAINLVLSGFVQPYSRYAYRGLVFQLTSGALGASVREGAFTRVADGFTLYVDDVREGGKTLLGIFVQQDHDDGRTTVMTARQGSFRVVGYEPEIVLKLVDGYRLDFDRALEPEAARRQVATITAGGRRLFALDSEPRSVLRFDALDVAVELAKIEPFRARGEGEQELTLIELWQARMGDGIRAPSGQPVSTTAIAAEFNTRLVRSLSVMIFPFLAIPLGVVRKRASGSFGIAFGVVALLAYHKTLEFGETVVRAGSLDVLTGLWLPLATFAIFAVYMFLATVHKVEGNPVLKLADWWDALIERLGDIVFRRHRHETHAVPHALSEHAREAQSRGGVTSRSSAS